MIVLLWFVAAAPVDRVLVATAVEVRYEPNLGSPATMALPMGLTVRQTALAGGFALVSSGRQELGYVEERYLAASFPAKPRKEDRDWIASIETGLCCDPTTSKPNCVGCADAPSNCTALALEGVACVREVERERREAVERRILFAKQTSVALWLALLEIYASEVYARTPVAILQAMAEKTRPRSFSEIGQADAQVDRRFQKLPELSAPPDSDAVPLAPSSRILPFIGGGLPRVGRVGEGVSWLLRRNEQLFFFEKQAINEHVAGVARQSTEWRIRLPEAYAVLVLQTGSSIALQLRPLVTVRPSESTLSFEGLPALASTQQRGVLVLFRDRAAAEAMTTALAQSSFETRLTQPSAEEKTGAFIWRKKEGGVIFALQTYEEGTGHAGSASMVALLAEENRWRWLVLFDESYGDI